MLMRKILVHCHGKVLGTLRIYYSNQHAEEREKIFCAGTLTAQFSLASHAMAYNGPTRKEHIDDELR